MSLRSDDVLPTGNDWIALPTIRASDGALENFNALSVRNRGLLQVAGERNQAALAPYFIIDDEPVAFVNPKWELIEYWIPVARLTADGAEMTLTYCAPPDSRAAFLHLTLTNRRTKPITTTLGVKASFGSLSRVTYLPVELRGERTVSEAPWVSSAETFSFITHDTQFAWALQHSGSLGKMTVPPQSLAPQVEAEHDVKLASGETAQADFVLAAGVEEFSAAHSAKALTELIDRHGADKIIADAAAWYQARTRTTGQPDLDRLMNRNFLFTAFFAWARPSTPNRWWA